MKLFSVVLLVLIIQVFDVAFLHENSFDVIRGCKLHDNARNYDTVLKYFPTLSLLHVGRTSNSKYFKIGILGPNNGIIRYGESMFPYDKEVMEIVLGGWENTKSAGRHQYQTASYNKTNSMVQIVPTPHLLSKFWPIMFVLEVFYNGTVQVRIDGQLHPFLAFNDSKRIPANYMTFTQYKRDMLFFYDCPLKEENTLSDSLLLNCTLV